MPDPSETDLERYWDGSRWTARTRNRFTRIETGVVAPTYDRADTSLRSYSLSAAPPKPRRGRRALVLLTVIAVAVGGYSYVNRAEVAPAVSEVASAVADATKPNGVDVDYPTFGSTELVTYLERGMIAQQSHIDVTHWARVNGTDSLTDAMSEAMTQNPYIYSAAYTVFDHGGTVTVEPDYPYDRDEGDRRRAATMHAVASGVAQSGASSATSDEEKVRLIHDYIVNVGTYDYAAFDEINAQQSTVRVQESQEAYGLLVNGTSVCNGYAQAFNAMAAAVGLTSVEVTGSDSAGATGGNHAWNKVLIDGEWLLVDTTWDDSGDELSHDYLLLRDDAPILASRTHDSDWVVDANMGNFAS